MDLKAFFRTNADAIAGLVVGLIVAQFVGNRISPEWGGVTLVLSIGAGVIAYLAVQRWFPESRG